MLEGLKKTFHGAAFPKGSEQCTKTLTGKAALLFLFKRLGVGGAGGGTKFQYHAKYYKTQLCKKYLHCVKVPK